MNPANTDIVTLRGSHATTLTKYRGILASGLFIPSTGRAGTGVYFWAEGRHYLSLATAWYNSRLPKYSKDTEKECIIVIATLSARKDEVLNFEDQKLKEAVDELREKRRIDVGDRIRIERLFDGFLSLYQERRGVAIKIVKMRVHFPQPFLPSSYSLLVLGWPLVYIARDPTVIERERALRHNHEPFEP